MSQNSAGLSEPSEITPSVFTCDAPEEEVLQVEEEFPEVVKSEENDTAEQWTEKVNKISEEQKVLDDIIDSILTQEDDNQEVENKVEQSEETVEQTRVTDITVNDNFEEFIQVPEAYKADEEDNKSVCSATSSVRSNRSQRSKAPSAPSDVKALKTTRESIEVGWLPSFVGENLSYFLEMSILGSDVWKICNLVPTR